MSETLTSESVQLSDRVNTTVIDKVLLRQLSPNDAKWDDRRAETDKVRELYRGTRYDSLAGRISACSGRLEFGFEIQETGESKLRLKSARFCRVRHCPVCQWRRSLMWRAKAFKILPQVVEAYPKHRFIFLTLTVRNCELGQLRETITGMNQAYGRLVKRAKWPADGWIRSLEVTRGKDGSAHPHFHCLLMVKASYFKGDNYLSQEAWTQLWEESLRINYRPIVHVQAVRPKNKDTIDTLQAILETLKYSVKPDDLIGESEEPTEENKQWLVELTTQLHKTRAVATGGILKEYLRELEKEPDDLIHADDGEPDSSIASLIFDWEQRIKKYAMNDRI